MCLHDRVRPSEKSPHELDRQRRSGIGRVKGSMCVCASLKASLKRGGVRSHLPTCNTGEGVGTRSLSARARSLRLRLLHASRRTLSVSREVCLRR